MKELIEELSSESVNILRVKILCKENPGLIATAGLRIKIWTLLLLGNTSSIDLDKDVTMPEVDCEEQQVLDADVPRTRSDVEEFRTSSWRLSLKTILQKFCVSHGIQYKQGMNEVLAPFLYVLPPPHGNLLPYSLFEAFLFRYLERFICVDDSSHLFKGFRLFHLLLLYFDPQLAQHLNEQDFPPELYSPQWFLTLYSRSMPLPHVLRLWDMMIAVDDPSFTFFIGLCLVRRRRTELLLSDRDRIPEIIVKMQFHGEEEIDAIVTEARELYRSTPKCFLRYLRLCCVSTTELMPQPAMFQKKNKLSSYTLNVHEYDRNLSLQAARSCFMLSTQELVNSVAPIQNNAAYEGNTESGNESDGSGAELPQQYVIIDIRSFDESVASGGGMLPRAIQLEPEFLQRPDAFDIWLQHFDGTRGCNICIIDMPPARWTGLALWRRLLLGEGDGMSTNSPNPADISSLSRHSAAKHATNAPIGGAQHRDLESRFAQEEAQVVKLDLTRPAMQLALALQANSFPNVSVLDGGFPALIEQLNVSRGTVEPVVINHDEVQWAKFLRATGRDYSTLEEKKAHKGSYANSVSKNADNEVPYEKPRTVRDLSRKEVYSYALKVADRLNHSYMKRVITDRLEGLEKEQEAKAEACSSK